MHLRRNSVHGCFGIHDACGSGSRTAHRASAYLSGAGSHVIRSAHGACAALVVGGAALAHGFAGSFFSGSEAVNNALKVFHALRTFDRPACRAELERESGLDYDQVHEGLRTLKRHHLLRPQKRVERRRLVYQLIEGAKEPQTVRGRYQRTIEHRQHVASLVRAHRSGDAPPSYSAAAAPSHSNQPGALRIIVKGVLDRNVSAVAVPRPCALAKLWTK